MIEWNADTFPRLGPGTDGGKVLELARTALTGPRKFARIEGDRLRLGYLK